jgi:LysM repeat protein
MKKTALLFLIICTWVNISRAAQQDSVGVTKINGKFHIRYMVSPGETIYRISTTYKVSVSDLMDINPDLEFGLKTGQILNIPYNPEVQSTKPAENATVVYSKTASSSQFLNTDSLTENGVVHTIQQGETYGSLAKRYNIAVEDLLKINKVELKAGQKVIINDKLKALVKSQESRAKNQDSKTQLIITQQLVNTQPATTQEPSTKYQAQSTNNQQPSEDPSPVPLEPIEYNNIRKNLLVIPFDPYLYFSDADDEIASVSKMQRVKVRQAFRRRLNALLEPNGYETIHLLGGKAKDSITDLNKIYSSVSYSYQSILLNPSSRIENDGSKGVGGDKKSNQPLNLGQNSRAAQAQDAKKYFGVKVSNPQFFTFFNNKYKIDYYLFINQFEVKTNYENCLDRATLNYERGFTIHYSIFDKNGRQVAGNRIYIDYNSNTNNISKILADNMQKVADRIMGDLPPAQ